MLSDTNKAIPLQCMYMYTKLFIYRAVITAYSIKGRIKMCFLCLFFFFCKKGMEEELLNWSLIMVNINWSMTWSSLIPNMEFLASPIWLRSIRDEVANPGVIVPGVTDMAPGYGVMKPPSI